MYCRTCATKSSSNSTARMAYVWRASQSHQSHNLTVDRCSAPTPPSSLGGVVRMIARCVRLGQKPTHLPGFIPSGR
jgi:hypothetical protein